MQDRAPDYLLVRHKTGAEVPVIVKSDSAVAYPADSFEFEKLYRWLPPSAEISEQVGEVVAWPDDFSRTGVTLKRELPAGTKLYIVKD